jgi:thioesterase-3
METTMRIKVRGYHEDRFRHVNNARYLEFLEDARWAHLEKRGLDNAFFAEHGIFPVVVRINISYRRPSAAGDVLQVTTRVAGAGSRKVIIAQTVKLEASGEICVEAEVTVVFLDEKTGRPVPINDAMRRAWPDLDSVTKTGLNDST